MTTLFREFRYLKLLTAFYVATLLIFNVLAVKLWHVGPMIFTAGILLVPITYIFGDVLTEVYGYARTRQVIWIGFLCNALMIAAIEIAILLPPAPNWHQQNAFAELLGSTPRIALASLLAYWVGEFANSYVVARMKVATEGRFLWARLVASTVVGQLIDSSVFIGIAFMGKVPLAQLLVMIVSVTVFKTVYECVAAPLTCRVVNIIKRHERTDVYDKDTAFTPFKWELSRQG